jgi:hypothetical protein
MANIQFIKGEEKGLQDVVDSCDIPVQWAKQLLRSSSWVYLATFAYITLATRPCCAVRWHPIPRADGTDTLTTGSACGSCSAALTDMQRAMSAADELFYTAMEQARRNGQAVGAWLDEHLKTADNPCALPMTLRAVQTPAPRLTEDGRLQCVTWMGYHVPCLPMVVDSDVKLAVLRYLQLQRHLITHEEVLEWQAFARS